MRKIIGILFWAMLTQVNLQGQDPLRFAGEIKKISQIAVPTTGHDLVVFTGSSSVRFWEELSMDCSDRTAINTGFGGSHMSDLLYHLEETVLRFRPNRVYIYEGDNDISAGKAPGIILETTKWITHKLFDANPSIKIYFISAKPSPSRWSFEQQYLEFNGLLKDYCASHHQLHYVNVWEPMLNDKGRPKASIFISDSLHMNRQGYLIWKEVMCGAGERK